MKLVHWLLMGGLLHLVQWAGLHPAQAPPHCTKSNSPPINSQCTNHRIAVTVQFSLNVPIKRLKTLSAVN